jgi:hypothetical protein
MYWGFARANVRFSVDLVGGRGGPRERTPRGGWLMAARAKGGCCTSSPRAAEQCRVPALVPCPMHGECQALVSQVVLRRP